MARPVRCRRICFEPKYSQFIPDGRAPGESNGKKNEEQNKEQNKEQSREQVLLTLDEFETIRLIDHEKKTHEQCARQMAISRTTVTEIYERARGKIADCIVNGKTLCISGGNYVLCDGSAWKSCGKKCRKINHALKVQGAGRREKAAMKIAVTYEDGNVFQHFGHTEQFKVYEVTDGKIVDAQVVSTEGSGHGALAGMLSEKKVDVLICGGIGGGAQVVLAEAGIKLYGGVTGSADDAVVAFLTGNLAFNPDVHCNHHHHEEGHDCGSQKHGCAGSEAGH